MKPLTQTGKCLNVSALAREHGVSRTTIRRRLASGWTPTHLEVLPPETATATPAHPPSTPGRPWTSIILVATALGIGGLAIAINIQQGLHLGATPAASWTFAGIAMAADVLAFALPSAGVALWHARRPFLATIAWTTWTLAATLAVMASLGFVERNVSDTAAGRAAVVTAAAATTDQRTAAIEAARIAANAATEARKAECLTRGPRCREREADERAALGALTSAIAAPIQATPALGTADPQITAGVRLATWVHLPIVANDLMNLRLLLLVAVPNLAGLVFAFGLALRRR
jgi:hypothetical protein